MDKGLYVKTTSIGQYGCHWVMPQSFLNKLVLDSQNCFHYLMSCQFNRVSGSGSSSVLRADASASSTTSASWNAIVSGAMFTNGGIPNGVSVNYETYKIQDYSNLRRDYENTVYCSSDYNDYVYSAIYSANVNFNFTIPSNQPNLRIAPNLNGNLRSEFWVKDIRLYVKRTPQ